MKLLAFILIFGTAVHAYFQECYVTPCTRDVIIVVDGSSSMQTSTYISQEINVITKLIYGWTLSSTQVRLALVGAYFGNEFSGIDYFTDSSSTEKRLQQFRISSMQYGLFDGNFNTTIRFLDERYVGSRASYGPRDNVQKRIIIFTAHGNSADVSSTKSKLQQFASLGYKVTLVGLGVLETVYVNTVYHKFVSIPFSQLISISQSVVDTIIEDGVCFYDDGVPTPKPQLCTTSTTTTTTTTQKSTTTPKAGSPTLKPTTPPRPTQPPFPVGDYQECSCTIPNLYLDIVFLVDTSKGMGDGLVLVKAEISTLVGQMTLDPTQQNRVQVGLVKYSQKAEIVFHPSDYTDEDEFNDDLWNDPKIEKVDDYDEVNLDRGLIQAEHLLTEMRSGVRKVIVVYASSYDDEGEHEAIEVAARIRASGHSIITIAFVEDEAKELVLSIGEIATKRMNFTSYRDSLLVEEIEDALCQVNCYCPSDWHQLVLEDRRYGECLFNTEIDAAWLPSKLECNTLSQNHIGNGHLVYVNSELKNNFLNQWYMDEWDEKDKEKPNYYIGYYYNTTLSQFMWVNGVTNNDYVNWKKDHPNRSIGDCAKAVLVEGAESNFEWESVNCYTDHGRSICQQSACDSDFYCEPPNKKS